MDCGFFCVCSPLRCAQSFFAHGSCLDHFSSILTAIRGRRIVVTGHHVGMPRRDAVVVGCRHIEIGSRKSLCIGRRVQRPFRYNRKVLCPDAQRFYVPIGRQVFAVGAFSKWVIASLPVHLAVGRIEVVGVGIHRVSVVEPAFGIECSLLTQSPTTL